MSSPERPKFPLFPVLIGFFVVIIASSLMGVMYYKTIFSPSSDASPMPMPSATLLPSPTLSPIPTAVSSAAPAASIKPSLKPVSALPSSSPVSSPTPTPSPITLDVRFGNPSAIVKQTYDDGSGIGRVINREYSSVQVGTFDEVTTGWSPTVTVCYQIVANESVSGKDVKLKFALDDRSVVEDSLSQYDRLEPGRLYSWCRDTTNDIGKHTAKLSLNDDKSLREVVSSNNVAKLDWENLADKIAPNISFGGPFDWEHKGTCFVVYAPSDNVNKISEIKVEQQADSQAWSSVVDGTYCFEGSSGSSHTYKVRAVDARGNTNEQSKSFVLY